MLAAALAGSALGAGPAVGARHHHRARLVARKARAHGHVPAQRAQRPPLTGTGTTTTAPAPPPLTGTVPTTPAPACPTALGVSEDEYHTRPSRSSLCAGAIVVELSNTGQDDHDMKILDLATNAVVATWDVVHPGDNAQKHLTLAAGTYRLFCTLSDGNGVHDVLGMHATVTVG
jgi:plastocyanin